MIQSEAFGLIILGVIIFAVVLFAVSLRDDNDEY